MLKVFLHHRGKIYHKIRDAKDKMKSIREGALGKYKELLFSTTYFVLVNSFNRPMDCLNQNTKVILGSI